jgi:hypothetical protein
VQNEIALQFDIYIYIYIYAGAGGGESLFGSGKLPG